jgi:peptidoglycan/LPS O-acetylase OafA/YrhL
MLGANNVDGAYWSLQPELLFYFVMVFIFAFRLNDKIILISLLWLLIIVLNYFFALEKHFLPIKLLNIRHGGLFVSGILFYQIYKNNASKFVYFLLVLSFFINLLIYTKLFDFWGALGTLSLIYALFTLFLQDKLNFLVHRYLLFMGAISYPLYLIHQNIGLILIAKLNAFFPFFISFPIVFILLIITAYLIHVFIEKPCQKLIK